MNTITVWPVMNVLRTICNKQKYSTNDILCIERRRSFNRGHFMILRMCPKPRDPVYNDFRNDQT